MNDRAAARQRVQQERAEIGEDLGLERHRPCCARSLPGQTVGGSASIAGRASTVAAQRKLEMFASEGRGPPRRLGAAPRTASAQDTRANT